MHTQQFCEHNSTTSIIVWVILDLGDFEKKSFWDIENEFIFNLGLLYSKLITQKYFRVLIDGFTGGGEFTDR